MRWYAILFWIWVVVSLGILVWRRVNGSGEDDGDVLVEEPSSALTKQWAPPPPDPEAPAAPGAPFESDPSTDDQRTPPAGPPPPPASDPSPPPSRVGTTLAELLSGITLPHGLVPLTQSLPASGPATSIVVATESAGPEQVATALADEIEGLGYTVRTTGEHTALAEGPRGAVEIEIHPHAGASAEGGSLRFPTAGANSVVVELRVAGSAGA